MLVGSGASRLLCSRFYLEVHPRAIGFCCCYGGTPAIRPGSTPPVRGGPAGSLALSVLRGRMSMEVWPLLVFRWTWALPAGGSRCCRDGCPNVSPFRSSSSGLSPRVAGWFGARSVSGSVSWVYPRLWRGRCALEASSCAADWRIPDFCGADKYCDCRCPGLNARSPVDRGALSLFLMKTVLEEGTSPCWWGWLFVGISPGIFLG